jgi:hypothetical protein
MTPNQSLTYKLAYSQVSVSISKTAGLQAGCFPRVFRPLYRRNGEYPFDSDDGLSNKFAKSRLFWPTVRQPSARTQSHFDFQARRVVQ